MRFWTVIVELQNLALSLWECKRNEKLWGLLWYVQVQERVPGVLIMICMCTLIMTMTHPNTPMAWPSLQDVCYYPSRSPGGESKSFGVREHFLLCVAVNGVPRECSQWAFSDRTHNDYTSRQVCAYLIAFRVRAFAVDSFSIQARIPSAYFYSPPLGQLRKPLRRKPLD